MGAPGDGDGESVGGQQRGVEAVGRGPAAGPIVGEVCGIARLLLSNPRESKITPILAQPLEKVKLAAFTVLDPLHRLPA
jgi:hypothetical protein